jgi:hypothetical protein
MELLFRIMPNSFPYFIVLLQTQAKLKSRSAAVRAILALGSTGGTAAERRELSHDQKQSD